MHAFLSCFHHAAEIFNPFAFNRAAFFVKQSVPVIKYNSTVVNINIALTFPACSDTHKNHLDFFNIV